MPKEVFIEDVIERVVRMSKMQLYNAIYPEFDPAYRVDPHSKSVLFSSIYMFNCSCWYSLKCQCSMYLLIPFSGNSNLMLSVIFLESSYCDIFRRASYIDRRMVETLILLLYIFFIKC